MRFSISEILDKVEATESLDAKLDVLRNNDSPPLRRILATALDPAVKILLPEGDPPYTPASPIGAELILLNRAKLLYLFIEGESPPNLLQHRREKLFIDILETVHPDDAKMLLAWKDKKFKQQSVTAKLVRKAFPKLF